MDDLISRQAAIKEAYEIVIDGDVFEVVQVETLMGLPPALPTIYGYDIEHLKFIALILEKEGLTPIQVREALTDMDRIVVMVRDEFETALKKSLGY